jgi:hypothetical protein
MPQYSIYVSCNQCGGEHPMGVGIHLDQGPEDRQSIGDVYQGEPLPPQVSAIAGHKCLCLRTGKLFTQEDSKRVFLVPVPWRLPVAELIR